MPEFTYLIKTNEGSKEDWRIEKHGLVVEFSPRELEEDIMNVSKTIKEMEANGRLQDSIAENVRLHNADLVELLSSFTPEKRHALFMLVRQEDAAREYSQKADQFRAILKTLEEQKVKVNALIGV